MIQCLFVGIGGFIGSVCRYLIGLIPLQTAGGFPIKTLIINICGAFLLGFITAMAAKNESLDPNFVLMLRVGICGGFTTFSTFAYEVTSLIHTGSYIAAVCYMALSMILGIAAVFAAELCA